MTEDEVREALRTVLDPDIGINIVDLGLVENIVVDGGRVRVHLIMTTPACPQGEFIRDEAAAAIRRAGGAGADVRVDLLPEPMWTPDRLSAEARARLGWG